MVYQKVCKKKYLSWVYGVDRKICHSGSLFGITRLAEWCRSVILVTDFSIHTLHPWKILIISKHMYWYLKVNFLRPKKFFWDINSLDEFRIRDIESWLFDYTRYGFGTVSLPHQDFIQKKILRLRNDKRGTLKIFCVQKWIWKRKQ